MVCGKRIDNQYKYCYDCFIKNHNKVKAQKRRKKSIKIMEKFNLKFNCDKCLHKITGSCIDYLPNGCEYYHETVESMDETNLQHLCSIKAESVK